MESTLQMMKQIAKEQKSFSFNGLCLEYRKSHAEEILALAFCSLYGLIIKMKSIYPNVTYDECASESLMVLHQALCEYDFREDTKFTTYFTALLRRAFFRENVKLDRKKRKAEYVPIEDVEYLCTDMNNYAFEINDFLGTFTKEEQIIIQKLLIGEEIKEIAIALKTTPRQIYDRRSKIRPKVKKYLVGK